MHLITIVHPRVYPLRVLKILDHDFAPSESGVAETKFEDFYVLDLWGEQAGQQSCSSRQRSVESCSR